MHEKLCAPPSIWYCITRLEHMISSSFMSQESVMLHARHASEAWHTHTMISHRKLQIVLRWSMESCEYTPSAPVKKAKHTEIASISLQKSIGVVPESVEWPGLWKGVRSLSHLCPKVLNDQNIWEVDRSLTQSCPKVLNDQIYGQSTDRTLLVIRK